MGALEKLQLEHQVMQNQLYIDLLSQKYRTLRQYQHDFKQHLSHIQQLAQQNQTESIVTYINTIYADLQSAAPLKLTGNQTLDLLLSDKLQQAQAKGVALRIDYQPQTQLAHIAAPDLCIILGNLLTMPSLLRRKVNAKKSAASFSKKIIITPPLSSPTVVTSRR